MPNDRSDAALRERLVIARKATNGPWKIFRECGEYRRIGIATKETLDDFDAKELVIVVDYDDYSSGVIMEDDAAHIAANSPDVVKADIEEILSLRAEDECLNKEADWLAKTLGVQVKDSFGCVWCWLSESDMCNGDCTKSLRNAARKAVEEEENV